MNEVVENIGFVSEKNTSNVPIRINKTWGHELIYYNKEYCMKLLYIESNKSTSIHFHVNKHETLFVKSGILKLKIYNKNSEHGEVLFLEEGEAFVMAPLVVHKLIAYKGDLELIEASTFSEDSDSIRIRENE